MELRVLLLNILERRLFLPRNQKASILMVICMWQMGHLLINAKSGNCKEILSPDDHIDDFLANGCALQGLISIVNSAGATVEGIGVAIEKGFQIGGQTIRNLGYQLESLAIVDAMDAETGSITFREQ